MQRAVHESDARYRVASWGRQSGKSTWAVNELLHKAWTKPNSTLWFIAPTFDQAKVQYRRLIGALWDCREVMIKKNQSELRVKFINGSQISFKSGESLDNLRGETLHGAIIDEVRDQHPELWTMVVRPMLTTTKGFAAFISTPRGFDQFYDLAQTAISDKSGQWAYFQSPSTCNPLFTQDEFESAKRDMTEPQFAQEILAEFRDLTAGKAYINFSHSNISDSNKTAVASEAINPHLPIVVGMDFNVNPMCWVLGQHRNGAFYFFDEIYLSDTNTQQAAKVLIDKVQGHRPGVVIIGDASGNSRSTKATESDYAIVCNALTNARITWTNQTPKANPPVKDRVNAVNAKLKNANGDPSLWIHSRCKMLRRDFERVVWKDTANGALLDQSGINRDLTHMTDALGYIVHTLSPQNIEGAVGPLRVIIR